MFREPKSNEFILLRALDSPLLPLTIEVNSFEDDAHDIDYDYYNESGQFL